MFVSTLIFREVLDCGALRRKCYVVLRQMERLEVDLKLLVKEKLSEARSSGGGVGVCCSINIRVSAGLWSVEREVLCGAEAKGNVYVVLKSI